MPQPTKGPRHGGSAAHQSMILANLATELFRHGRIRTTLAKAKSVQPLAERMITFAKRGDVAARRQVLKVIRDKDVVHKLFTDVGPAFAERNGGYTRVLKLGARKGDAAPMALIELVEGVSVRGAGDLEEQPRRRWSLRRRRGTISTTARETAEERQAAVDRGEDLAGEYEDEAIDAVPAGSLQDADEDDLLGGTSEGEPEPEVSAADVEARLAAMDTEADAASADDITDRESVEAAEGVEPAASDAGDDEPTTGPIPADEQDAPAPERPADNQPTPTDGDSTGPQEADEQDAPAEERPPEG